MKKLGRTLFAFLGLTAGVAMTVRATAPGYATEEKTIYPGGDAVSAIIFEPLPLH